VSGDEDALFAELERLVLALQNLSARLRIEGNDLPSDERRRLQRDLHEAISRLRAGLAETLVLDAPTDAERVRTAFRGHLS